MFSILKGKGELRPQRRKRAYQDNREITTITCSLWIGMKKDPAGLEGEKTVATAPFERQGRDHASGLSDESFS